MLTAGMDAGTVAIRHRLLCDDILTEIFQYPMANIDLSNAARVCKDFADHALDALWRDMMGLGPLLRLFSSVKYSRESGAIIHSTLDTKQISPEEWTRFQRYARRVRTITYTSDYAYALHDVAVCIQKFGGSKHLFPSLRHLHWNLPYIEVMDECLPSLFSPLLRYLSLSFDDVDSLPGEVYPEHALWSFVETLSHEARELQELDSYPIPVLLQSLVSSGSPIRSFSTDLEPTVQYPHMFQVLAQLESLTDLTVSCHELRWDITPAGPFPSLQSLTLLIYMPQMTKVVAAISAPRLCSIVVEPFLLLNPKVQEYDEFMQAVVSMYGQTLRRLHCEAIPRNQERKSLLDNFRPLLQLHNLEDVMLIINDYSIAAGLSAENVCDIAHAWPLLAKFSLEYLLVKEDSSGSLGHDHLEFPPLASLADFARFCPRLTELDLPFVLLPPLPFDEEGCAVACHPLRQLSIDRVLSVFDYQAHDYARVARFLRSIFPSLDIATLGAYEHEWGMSQEAVHA